MRRLAAGWFALALGLAVPVRAARGADDAAAAGAAPKEEAEPERDVGDTIARRPPPPLRSGRIQVPGHTEFVRELEQYAGRPYPAIEYLGAAWLGVDVEFLHDCRVGLEYVYRRDYKAAKAHFDRMSTRWPDTGLGPVGQVLVWQALMVENFDFRYDRQYRRAFELARGELETAIRRPGNEAFEYFLLGGVLGIEAIHTARKKQYLKALARAYEAMKALARSKEAAPEFRDLLLGDGLYNYWVSVISRSSKAIPDTPDRREEGLVQLKTVEMEGVFLRPPATLALTFSWIEEGKRRRALAAALRNHRAYPDNVINELLLGRIYTYNRNYRLAEQTFLHVLEVAPDNMRVHYHLGRLYLRWRRYDQALASLDRYVAFEDVSDHDRGVAHYYRGNVFYRLERWDEAEAAYREAWRLARLERAKRRIERVRAKRAKAAG